MRVMTWYGVWVVSQQIDVLSLEYLAWQYASNFEYDNISQ